MNSKLSKEQGKIKVNDTRAKALRLARSLLQTRGLHGFSFQNIADQLGIQKASLHYYFNSKEELTSELIIAYQAAFERWVEIQSGLSATQKLQAMVKMFVDMIGKDHRICPVGSLCVDFQSLSIKNQQLLTQLHFAQRDWLRTTVEQGQQEGAISKKLQAQNLADQIMATVQGGMQVARLRKDADFLREMLEHYLVNIISH